ncbi:MAG: glutamine--fructose-6-phosphate transaminase (isomerizing) [Coriobacteriia bacterium]|nr:glutamine--fructose-6-phosphate transaminase (isomerizing) [Coriobacteriia bacterium]
MCGIVGFTGTKPVKDFLLEGLHNLEYRGYDSAGIALLLDDNSLFIKKRSGAVDVLEDALHETDMPAQTGIGHTRWATHGAPSEINAHPHFNADKSLALVHNGIIENSYVLRESLEAEGYHFVSETDTEVIVHLLDKVYKEREDGDLLQALIDVSKVLEGSYAIVLLSSEHPGELFAVRNGSPLVLAKHDDGAYIASDVIALVSRVKHVITMDNNEFAHLKKDGSVHVYNDKKEELEHIIQELDVNHIPLDNGEYPDFMLKEMNEQPDVIERLGQDRFDAGSIRLDGLNLSDEEIKNTDKIFIVACGTSYHASLLAKNYIENLAGIPVEVAVASEFANQHVLVTDHTLCIIVTQSGETADTLAAARKIKDLGARVFAITNVLGSTAARESDGVIYTKAGPEVSVAATKTFVAQIVAVFFLALFFAEKNGRLSSEEVLSHLKDIQDLSVKLGEVLSKQEDYEKGSRFFAQAHSALFIGRSLNYPIASEGALKLKEISYLHAEAYPAGEIKHGPFALLEPGFPVVVVIPHDDTRAKTLSNIKEIRARGAVVLAVATQGDAEVEENADFVFWVPSVPPLLTPLISVIPLQILARKVALDRGQNVDRPRNLAKSVTVE